MGIFLALSPWLTQLPCGQMPVQEARLTLVRRITRTRWRRGRGSRRTSRRWTVLPPRGCLHLPTTRSIAPALQWARVLLKPRRATASSRPTLPGVCLPCGRTLFPCGCSLFVFRRPRKPWVDFLCSVLSGLTSSLRPILHHLPCCLWRDYFRSC